MKKYVLLFLFSAGIGADDLTHEAFRPDCTGNLSLNKIADCVLDHSPEFKNSKHELNAIKGRKISAGYLFPSNPIFTVMNSHRKQGSAENSYSPLRASVNGEVMLSQEIYIGGQRKGKLDIADSEFAAQVRRVTVMERETIAGAFSSAINYAGALHEYKLASEISALALDLYKITKARAEKGLIAPIDSDVAGSEAIRSQRIFLSAKRRLETAKGNLTVMMGIPYDSEINILPEISYPSLGGSNVAYLTNEALRIRADKEAADLDVSVAEKKVTLLRRENIPNLTVSAFLQKDGFDENVIGGRLSMPLRFWRDNS
ncbi:MAG: TolC family protein, partial [Leptospira sp.]|nr:TolC family protein [Leptospira sp.]